MTLGENVALPMQEYAVAGAEEISALASLKLALVGLAGFEDYYPAEISGGMTKRAGLARAMALDPDILFFDEPSAGLDPITSRRLDDLILDLRDSLGATIVVVTHELASIFAIGDNSVLLDGQSKAMIASGNPKQLLAESKDPAGARFPHPGRSDQPCVGNRARRSSERSSSAPSRWPCSASPPSAPGGSFRSVSPA